jgi:hypothetical protein
MEIFLGNYLVFPEIPVHYETRRFTAEFTKPATGETAVAETLSGLFSAQCSPTSFLIETYTLVC